MVEVKSHTKKINGKTINVKSYSRKEPVLSASDYLNKVSSVKTKDEYLYNGKILTKNTISNKYGKLEILENPRGDFKNSVYLFRVDEAKRNHGIGTALITEAISQYGKTLMAQVSSPNSLRFFYKNGFRHNNLNLNESLKEFDKSSSLYMENN